MTSAIGKEVRRPAVQDALIAGRTFERPVRNVEPPVEVPELSTLNRRVVTAPPPPSSLRTLSSSGVTIAIGAGVRILRFDVLEFCWVSHADRSPAKVTLPVVAALRDDRPHNLPVTSHRATHEGGLLLRRRSSGTYATDLQPGSPWLRKILMRTPLLPRARPPVVKRPVVERGC